ncbi:MAG: DUF4884 domain-containing protein [Bacteroidales bacterium]|nr:DUF4884 domain-containing protein [Bacteroidales bacterium]
MKKLYYSIGLAFTAGLLYSCTIQQPISHAPAKNNDDYQISYLFEHEGCKVYRFCDEGRYVYFTTTQSDVTIIPNDSTVITNTVRNH